ncbi:MAG: amidohydrolase family protein, partial [Anaerolineae bacterium]|nr:amidohydrolase family protein [Anaerolineae bacterium]
KIAAMPDGESEIKPDYSIDLQGKTAIPGLFNTHCHVHMTASMASFSFKGMRLQRKYSGQQIARNMSECLSRGITYIRDALSEDLASTQALRSRFSREPGPRILQSVGVASSGSYFAPQLGFAARMAMKAMAGGIIHSSSRSGTLVFPADASESQVRDAVDRAIDERGAEAIKIGEQRYDTFTLKPTLTIMTMQQLRALADQARKRGLQTLMHHISVESFRRGVEAGVSSLSHLPFDDDLTLEDGKAFIASGCVIEPTVSSVYDLTWKVEGDPWQGHPDKERLYEYRASKKSFADIAEEFYIPELREAISGIQERFSREDFKVLGLVDMGKLFRAATALVPLGIGNLRKLYQWGAPIALANDSGAFTCTPPMMSLELALLNLFLNQELGEMIFSGADALKIATINSARSMGLADRFGSLEAGKTADIAIVDGNPFEDFRVIGSRVAALFMDGRLVIDNCALEVERKA